MASHIFVYGTLRSDDDSGSAYNRAFNALVSHEVRAAVHGASLYMDHYPRMVLDNPSGSVSGLLVTSYDLPRLLELADRIELGCGLYERVEVDACAQDGSVIRAYAYVSTSCSKSVPIVGGDWVVRDKEAVTVALILQSLPEVVESMARVAARKAMNDVRAAISLIKHAPKLLVAAA